MDLLDYSDRDAFRSSTLGKVLNFLLVLLILISYVPQYFRIKSRLRTYGISSIYIFLRSIYATSCLANILVLPSAWKIQQGCRDKSPTGQCMIEMMDVWQFSADWVGSHVIFVLCLYYSSSTSLDSPRQQGEAPAQEHVQGEDGQQDQQLDQDRVQEQEPNWWRKFPTPFRVAIIVGLVLEVFLLIPSLFFAINPRVLSPGYYIIVQSWSFGTVGLSSILTLVYSLPQLYYSWNLGRVGSLSLLTMAIQIPTYFLVAASLAFQYGRLDEVSLQGRWFAAWNSWINLLIKGCQEAIILALCIYLYERSATQEATSSPALDENTPLLSDRQDYDAIST